MKKMRLWAAVLSCILGLTACAAPGGSSGSASGTSSGQPPETAGGEIGFLFYTGEHETDDMTVEELMALETEATAAHWDLSTGEIRLEEGPMVRIRGGSHWDAVAAWDGADSVVLRDRGADLEVCADLNEILYQSQGEDLTVQGHTYGFVLTPQGECTITAGGEQTQVQLAGTLEKAHGDVPFSRLSYLKSALEGTRLTIVFVAYGQEEGTDSGLVYAAVDIQGGTVEWSGLIPVPREYLDGLIQAEPNSAAFASGRLYLSGWDTIVYLDTNTGRVEGLEPVTEALDALFPQARRVDSQLAAVEETCPVGGSRELAVCRIQYEEPESGASHSLYYALRGDRLAGAMSLDLRPDGAALTTYGPDLELLETVDVSHLQLKSVPLEFQSDSYP